MLQLVANFCFDYLKVETIPKRNQFRKGKNRMRVNLETARKIVYSYELELRLSIYSKIFNFYYLNFFFFFLKIYKKKEFSNFSEKMQGLLALLIVFKLLFIVWLKGPTYP